MRILVTGAAGFIGTHLCGELRDNGHDVFAADIRDGADQDMRVPDNVEAAIDEHWPDVLVHLAARVGRLFGEDDVAQTIAENAAMTATVAQACGDRGVRVVYASTSEVYGDTGEHGVGMDDPLPGDPLHPWIHCGDPIIWRTPSNVYGLSKRWGEEACRLYAPDGLVLLRFSMPYGPGLPAGRGRAALINFLYNALHGMPLTVHRGAERSWCWIGDTVRGARLAIESGQSGAWNVGRDDNAIPMLDVARMACDLVGAPHSLIVEVDAPARQTVVKRLSTAKLRRLGWAPLVELEEGMARTLEWVRALSAPAEETAA